MDQAELQSDFRGDDPAPKDPVERACQTDESGDPLRPATTRNDPGTHLGIAVAEVAVLADPKVPTEGQLEAAPQRVAVNGRNGHLRQCHQPIEGRLEAAAE